MTTNVPAVKPPIQAGGQVAALVPQTLDEAFRVAQAIAASGLAPKGLEKPEQVMVAIMAGAELGFAPFQSLQSFAVVNGRPTLWGDGLVAVVRRNGCTIREWHEGDTAHCEVVRPDTGETITRSFSQADAIKAGLAGKQGPWTQYPQRMRAMRARAWAVRDGCADMLRGFQIAEEVADYQPIRDVTPPTSGLRARLEANRITAPDVSGPEIIQDAQVEDLAAELDAASANTIAHDAETGEILEQDLPGHDDEPEDEGFAGDAAAPVSLASDSFDPASWAIDFNQEVHKLKTVDAIRTAWADAKAKGYVLKLKALSPAKLKALTDSMDARVAEIEGDA